jgi:membrane-bound lytic murein transglycosylase B
VTLCAILLCACGAGAAKRPDLQAEVDAFVDEMAREHGFDRTELSALMERAEFEQSIIDAMMRPAEAKPWYQYRPIFVTESRIRDGVKFWQANEGILERVSAEYGVPPEILVAIIGVETRYGGYTGRHRVLDSLHTLAFGYPRRATFFRGELEAFLLLAREEGIDPVEAKGSYAGAMGKPQFISSSYRAYAVDYDDDGRRDLWDSNADVIASVANYFTRHGWRRGSPVTVRVRGVDSSHRSLVEAGMKPSLRVEELREAGLEFDPEIDAEALASLIELDTGPGKEYWLGLHNFYVITRYNHSNLYSMAVYQLSQAIRALREAREIDPLAAR